MEKLPLAGLKIRKGTLGVLLSYGYGSGDGSGDGYGYGYGFGYGYGYGYGEEDVLKGEGDD